MQLRQHLPIPEFLPAIAGMQSDSDANLWLLAFPDPLDRNEAAVWRVFGPDGRLLTHVSLPERFTPLQIGADFVLGVWRDELDVEYVQLLCLLKPEAACPG
jgi:hypothetical protein